MSEPRGNRAAFFLGDKKSSRRLVPSVEKLGAPAIDAEHSSQDRDIAAVNRPTAIYVHKAAASERLCMDCGKL